MTDSEHAFLLLSVDGTAPPLEADPSDPTTPRWSGDGIKVHATSELGSSVVRQAWSIRRGDYRAPMVELRLRGRLDRPALAEITELDPPPPTGATTAFEIASGTVRVWSPELPAEVGVAIVGAPVDWRQGDHELRGVIEWPRATRDLAFTIELETARPPSATDRPVTSPPDPGPQEPELLVRRALAYVRGCTTLVTAPDERVILTDHRILPLSWTRDAYWQALALLAGDRPGDRERVADHLRWLWRRCERPDGRWVRSHHANGRRKDLAFQADQQLYPIVELADYWRLTASLPDGVAWGDEVARAWDAALEHVRPDVGLIASDENAADDPVAAPFITSSQIVLWYAALRAAEIADAGDLDLDPAALRDVGTDVRTSFDRWIGGGERAAWPYAVDALGQGVPYHDANDLPVALAPLWGICAADDPGWNATMAFALSAANPGWVPGRRSGLGSAHTPGPWSLGILQTWIRARAIGDDGAADAASRRLEEIAFVDGMLPEAYDPDGDARVRHWFAWPGAALAALRLFDRAECLEERLSASAIE